MRVGVASDHAGFPLKQPIMGFVSTLGHDVTSCARHLVTLVRGATEHTTLVRLLTTGA